MVDIAPLRRGLIAEMRNVDLAGTISDATMSAIHEAWAEYPVLVFVDQELDVDAQQAFASRFGPLAGRVRPVAERGVSAQENPHLMVVSNIRDNQGQAIGSGYTDQTFHTDGCFQDLPMLATFLYGIEAPTHGGETLFVDMNMVYETISPSTQRRILGRDGVNYHNFGYRDFIERGGTDRVALRETVRHAVHPMVISHPVTGRPIVFANRHNTREIIGLEQSESDILLNEIFETVERKEGIYAHRWRVGDLVMWDNRAVQHARAPCDPNQRRLLRRFAVRSDARPQPYLI